MGRGLIEQDEGQAVVDTDAENEAYEVFSRMERHSHEQVTFFRDEHSGLKAIVAIHDTSLGPALGGCRMWPYASEAEAFEDAMRLSRGMTYKASIAGLNLGGGKAVIIGDPRTQKSEMLFRAFGRFIDGLSGRYITAEDVGTTTDDMENVLRETNFVTGLSGSLGGTGDPSPVTSFGTFCGIKACVEYKMKKNSLSGLSVAVQGLGAVGMDLARLLHEEGVQLYVTDIDEEAVQRAVRDFDATAMGPDEIYDAPVDIFAPCALGAILNGNTIPRLRCSIVGGSANNQLARTNLHAPMLHKAGILYAPDYVINSGGLINAANGVEGYSRESAFQRTRNIHDTLLRIFHRSDAEGVLPNQASDEEAEQRILNARKLKFIHKPRRS